MEYGMSFFLAPFKRIGYSFDNTLSRGTLWLIVWLAVFSVGAVGLITLIVVIFGLTAFKKHKPLFFEMPLYFPMMLISTIKAVFRFGQCTRSIKKSYLSKISRKLGPRNKDPDARIQWLAWFYRHRSAI